MTHRQAAALFGVSLSTIRRLRNTRLCRYWEWAVMGAWWELGSVAGHQDEEGQDIDPVAYTIERWRENK